MDGSEREVIVPPGVVSWPNGLSLDLVMDRLYWVDAKLHLICSSNLHGSNIPLSNVFNQTAVTQGSAVGSPGDVAWYLLLFHIFDHFYPHFQF